MMLFLAEQLNADIVTWFATDKTFNLSHMRVKQLGKPILTPGIRHFYQNLLFRFGTRFLKDYDVVIFSGNSLSAVNNVKGLKILYCHTPPRYAYDQLDNYAKRFPAFMRPAFKIGVSIIQNSFKKNLQKMDHVIANSATVAKRLKDYFGINAPIIYPPCDIVAAKIYPRKPANHFISWARLEPMKRIDVLIEAFKKRPDKTLIIASFGSLKEKLEKQADGSFHVATSRGITIHCKAVIIAAGCGAFGPNRPPMENLEEFEEKSVRYMVARREDYRGKKIVIAGGGHFARARTMESRGIDIADAAGITAENLAARWPEIASMQDPLVYDDALKAVGATFDALQRRAGPDSGGGVGQRGAPVHADDGSGAEPVPMPGDRLGHRAQQFGGAHPEMGHRHPVAGELGEHPGAVRQHVAAVVGLRQRPRPRVENLDGVHPGVELQPQERDGQVGEELHQRMPGGRFAEHHRLGAFVQLAGAALDEIGRQREGRPGEPDQRHLPQRRGQQPNRVRDGADTVEHIRSQRGDVARGAHRMGDHRPHVGHDVQIDAGAAQRDNDVGEQDRGVHPVPVHRLQGDLADQLGVETGLHHGVLGAQRAVLGQRPAGLAHEPDRDAAGFATARGRQVRRLG